MNWGDNWVGAHLIQSIDLQAYTLQPTISYKFWDKLSVGVGMTITWGTFDLSRSMFPRRRSDEQYDRRIADRRSRDNTPNCSPRQEIAPWYPPGSKATPKLRSA